MTTKFEEFFGGIATPPDPNFRFKFPETTMEEVVRFAKEYPGTFPGSGEPWNKGKKGVQDAWNKGLKMDNEFRRKNRESHLGIDKGRSYEDRYGPEKAAEMRKIRSEKMKQTRSSKPEKFIPWNKKK